MKYCANCGASLSGLVADPNAPRDSEHLPPGTIVGSYRLLELLGEGGMGRVYVAEHTKLGRRVAVKMLRAEFAQNPVAISRFFAEARAVNRISHENIVEITDFLEKAGGHNCYIMELLNGEDLGIRLMRDEAITVVTAVEIAAQIASALQAVHAAGIIHRDLKPDNIFLIERGGSRNFVKLLDFGVAKLTDPTGGTGAISTHATAQGQIIGTPEYMSPEQAGGQTIDHRTDIYALGVVLYELITGEIPFKAKNFGELVIKHMTVPPKPPKQIAKHPDAIPDALEALVLELLAKDASERPQSMAEVEERLHAIHEAMDVPVQPRRFQLSGAMPRLSKPMAAATPAPFDATAPTLDAPGDAAKSGSIPIRFRTAPARAVSDASGAHGQLARSSSEQAAVQLATADDDAPPAPTTRSRRTLILGLGAGAAAIAVVVAVVVASGSKSTDKPAASPPAAAVAKQVHVRFASTPAGASVRVKGEERALGVTPFVATLPRSDTPITVQLDKDGFESSTQEVVLATDALISATLVAAPAVAPPPVATQQQPPPPVAVKTAPPRKLPPTTSPQKTATKPTTPTTQQTKTLDRGGTMDVFGGP